MNNRRVLDPLDPDALVAAARAQARLCEPLHEAPAYVSFGAGVQSTALALLVINRDERLIRALVDEAEFWRWPRPSPLPADFAFADTGDEPRALYPHVEHMAARIEQAGGRLHVVRRPGPTLLEHLEQTLAQQEKNVQTPPLFVHDGQHASGRCIRRGCTFSFKARVLDRWARERFDIKRGRRAQPVFQWLGISSDEIQRMKRSTDAWRLISHPLVFMRWSREHCIEYVERHGLEPMRSACVYCPFRSREQWRAVKADPLDWEKVLRLDALLERAVGTGWAGLRLPTFLTADGQRISDVDFDAPPPNGQGELFGLECAGVCGV